LSTALFGFSKAIARDVFKVVVVAARAAAASPRARNQTIERGFGFTA
jgi:hypothetical protein